MRDLWRGYELDRAGLAVLGTMKHTFKAIEPRFGDIPGDGITIADCRAHTEERRKKGIKNGTINTELGHLRMVLLWARDHGLISNAPKIERPQKPAPKDRHLEKHEAVRLIAAAKAPHVQLAIHLMLATAARVSAILELKWDRVDFNKRQIYLRDPDDPTRRKGRAVVPINDTLYAALKSARSLAASDYVVEWAGGPVKSLKRGIATAAREARLDFVTPHVCRHSAAVWMAEGGRSMSEIAQYLGHNDSKITERVYARFSPSHLREAASTLELGFNIVPTCSMLPKEENKG